MARGQVGEGGRDAESGGVKFAPIERIPAGHGLAPEVKSKNDSAEEPGSVRILRLAGRQREAEKELREE